MRFILIIIFCVSLISCQNSTKSSNNKQTKQKTIVKKSLEEIKKDGKLKAITTYSGTTYFLYKGKPMGFEYELLERLAKHLELELEMVIAKDEDSLIDMLNEGKGDLIAYGYTITEDRKKKVSFTKPLYTSHQVLIQRKPDYWRQMKIHEINEYLVKDPIELLGDSVSVKLNSSYAKRIKNLSDELGGQIFIDPIPGETSTDSIIKMLVDKKIDYTIADQNIAFINASYYPILDISTKVSFAQRIAWATRPNNPELLAEINNWITNIKKTVDYHVIYNKYYKNKRLYKRRVVSDFYSLNEGKISPYDDLIKTQAQKLGIDWRLLTSLMYQESRFKPNEESWVGAQGLMQLMPATGRELGVKQPFNPKDNIQGGTKYLAQLLEEFEDVPDSLQRIKFALASYNSGLYHVKDAQRLAEIENQNPKMWDNNVEESMLKLSSPKYYNKKGIKYGYVRGREPYNYVKEIMARYDHYKRFIDQ
ncbi:transglycosylase SLT domain-containing protein [Psychroflexus sp. ALD_RP9]|uniref:transglycosylase SLT domain-containing protein n=1 Tax=Psychroflexus sp. ALD_RP9 TaxID=2777186 RepID=UPI001A8DEC79|nr:transporter substrate-binding domain-containing protein [Psychroflexus sp. ALD_RP9]QSS97100.1 transporter substrate-binding domain-containing protein [Psychroflexus sp. ALD_RP9]